MSTFQTLLALVVLIYVLCVIVQAVSEFFKKLISPDFMQGILKGSIRSKAGTMREAFDEFMGAHLPVSDVEGALKVRGLDITALEHFSKEDFRHLLDAIDNLEPKLGGLVASATAGFEKKKDNVAAAFEGAMARFQALYTKYNKRLAIVLSFLVVLALNSNLIFLYEELASDQATSQALVTAADKLVQSKGNAQAGAGTATSGPTPTSGPPQQATSQPASPDAVREYENTRDCVKKLLKDYPVLARWKPHEKGYHGWTGQLSADARISGFKTLLGLVLMWMMVSLGAPFWNDLLKGATSLNRP